MSISQGGNKNGSPLKSRLGWTSPDFCRGKLNDPHSLVKKSILTSKTKSPTIDWRTGRRNDCTNSRKKTVQGKLIQQPTNLSRLEAINSPSIRFYNLGGRVTWPNITLSAVSRRRRPPPHRYRQPNWVRPQPRHSAGTEPAEVMSDWCVISWDERALCCLAVTD